MADLYPRRLLFPLALLLLGCAPRGMETPPRAVSTTFPPPLVRVVTPFDVRDDTGRTYAYPFLGGLNLPRPQLIDIDADGDQDLFVQEASGQVMLFERVGSSERPEFAWRTDWYQEVEVGEWYRFVDIDRDGDFDLLAERPFSYLQLYRNEGTAERASLAPAIDTLKDVDGEAIFSDRQNIPNVSDIDCDDELDLFIGQLVGSITRFEEVARDAEGVPQFRHVTDRFEDIEIIAQIGSHHGANTLAIVDIDGDGDQDIFWGDFFEPGLLFIENTGTCENPSLRDEPVPFPVRNPFRSSGYNAPAFGDLDGDDDLDLLVGVIGGAFNPNRTAIDNLFYFTQERDGDFTLQTRRFLTMVDVGSESFPALVDLDGDDDLDLLLANKIDADELQTSRIYQFENQGTPRRPSFQLTGAWDIRGMYHYAPAFADLDADNDLDMVLGSWKDELAYYRNDGSAREPNFVLADSVLVELTRGSNATPALVDIDADGDFDLFVGEASGAINFYRNAGTPHQAHFELVSDTFHDIDVGRRSAPTFADLDGDGDFDLVFGRDAGDLVFFRNTGTPTDPLFVADTTLTLSTPGFSTPVFADIDGDGDLDLFAGGFGGGVLYYENRSSNR